jgi:hypothetical protein
MDKVDWQRGICLLTVYLSALLMDDFRQAHQKARHFKQGLVLLGIRHTAARFKANANEWALTEGLLLP